MCAHAHACVCVFVCVVRGIGFACFVLGQEAGWDGNEAEFIGLCGDLSLFRRGAARFSLTRPTLALSKQLPNNLVLPS